MKTHALLRAGIFGLLVGWVHLIAAQETEFEIWPKGLPADAKPLSPEIVENAQQRNSAERIFHVQTPTLSVYRPEPADANGCAVIVCPGGGYNMLAWAKEGVEVARWFNSIGVTAFVLKYRVPRRDPDRIHWEPMQDIQRSIRLVRGNAKAWGIDPNRLGVLGFSAGGHLTVMAGVQYGVPAYTKVDAVDELSCRPDFICPIYAAYLADGYRDDVVELGRLVAITEETPPTFMAVTWDDKMRGAQAALMLAELKKNNVMGELHVYSKGGHGYGMRDTGSPVSEWNDDLANWLKSSGFMEAK